MAEYFFYATIMVISIIFYIYLAAKFVKEQELRHHQHQTHYQCYASNNPNNQSYEDSPLINKMQSNDNNYSCNQSYYQDNADKNNNYPSNSAIDNGHSIRYGSNQCHTNFQKDYKFYKNSEDDQSHYYNKRDFNC